MKKKLLTNRFHAIRKKFTCVFISGIIILLLTQFKEQPDQSNSIKLNFKWYKAYDGQTWEHVKTGMIWSFSSLGAMLPKGSLDSALMFSDSTLFEVDLQKLGFQPESEKALQTICNFIKQTPDYRKNQFIDLSRFFMLTLHAPYNYYRIVGVEKTYKSFEKRYHLDDAYVFGLTKSSVSKGHRLIRLSKDTTLFRSAFVAEEGEGSLTNGTFQTVNFEVVDIMRNGQLRFAIYDKNGQLTDASDSTHSFAGKPSKCMWCHELYIQPLYSQNTAVSNMMSNEEFTEHVKDFQEKLDRYRNLLDSEIDFHKKQDHTYSELLYITFMEPPVRRLREEFQSDGVLTKLKKMTPHIDKEFSFLGELYQRKVIDSLFSYPKLSIPEHAREKSNFEPNYFNQ